MNSFILLLVFYFIISAIFIFIANYSAKTLLTSLFYSSSLFIVNLIFGIHDFTLLFISFVVSFLISFALFAILKYFKESFWAVIISAIGFIVILYVSYLPIGFAIEQMTRRLLQ